MLAAVDQLRSARDDLARWLADQGLEVADSDANFVLFGRFADRHAVWQALLDQGVLIREVGPDGWLRSRPARPTRWRRSRPPARRAGSTCRRASSEQPRTRQLERATSESSVKLSLDLDGTGRVRDLHRGAASTTTC